MTPEVVSHNSPFHFLSIISTLLGAAGSTTRHRKRFRAQTPKTKSQFKCGMCVNRALLSSPQRKFEYCLYLSDKFYDKRLTGIVRF
jgi:hypothetical protein